MKPEQLRDLAIAALEELKATDITVLKVSELTSITDYMIITSGRSSRHVKSLAGKVIESAKHAGETVIGAEGLDQGEWVLIDLGDVIVHVMQPAIRDYYQLEKLWAEDGGASLKKPT